MEKLYIDVLNSKQSFIVSYLGKNIKSLGIISAENPTGKKSDDLENDKRTTKLEMSLRRMGLRFIHVTGKFKGMKEKAFLVINIERDKLLELARKFEQKVVIFGNGTKFSHVATDGEPEKTVKDGYVFIGTRKFKL